MAFFKTRITALKNYFHVFFCTHPKQLLFSNFPFWHEDKKSLENA